MATANQVEHLLRSQWPDAKSMDVPEAGNSWVFSATHGEARIAIKVLRRLHRYNRFLEEIRVVRALGDLKGIVPILDFVRPTKPRLDGDLSELPYYTMPLYRNGSLARRLSPITDGGRKQ